MVTYSISEYIVYSGLEYSLAGYHCSLNRAFNSCVGVDNTITHLGEIFTISIPHFLC